MSHLYLDFDTIVLYYVSARVFRKSSRYGLVNQNI